MYPIAVADKLFSSQPKCMFDCFYTSSLSSSTAGYPLAANISPTVLVAGETFSLTCDTLYNYPAASITWARANGEPLPRRFSVNEQEQLVISPSAAEDEIEICCVASNSYGHSNITASLTVYGELGEAEL